VEIERKERWTNLETNDIGLKIIDLLQDELLTVVPMESPGWRVAVHGARCVFLVKNIVAKHAKVGASAAAVGVYRDPFAVWRRQQDWARVTEIGDEGARSLSLDNDSQMFGHRISLDTQNLELMEGTKLWRQRGEMVVEEEKLTQRCHHA
jgi:hypothetical protein